MAHAIKQSEQHLFAPIIGAGVATFLVPSVIALIGVGVDALDLPTPEGATAEVARLAETVKFTFTIGAILTTIAVGSLAIRIIFRK